MEPRHSILPVDHWTTGLSEEELRGLVERHSVSFEVHPHQIGIDGSVRRDGWTIDLYGMRSEADEELHLPDAAEHLDDVLRSIARAVVPEDTAALHVELSPFTGAVRMDPKRGFAEQVRLRVSIEPMTTARQSIVAGVETDWVSDVSARLEALGCKRR